MNRPILSQIQFARGAAAALVVCDHLLERLVRRGLYGEEVNRIAWALGEVGISTFFVISGFVIAHRKPSQSSSWSETKTFIGRRFRRIAPLYYLTTVLYIAYRAAASGELPSTALLIKSFLFTAFVQPYGIGAPVYSVGWTLEYEMVFYCIFGLSMMLSKRVGLWAAVFILSILTIYSLLSPDAIFRPFVIYFAIGLVISWLYDQVGPQTLLAPSVLICSIASVVLCAASLIDPFWRVPVVGGVIGVLALTQPVTDSPSFNAIARRMGDISYSLYLTHSFIVGGVVYFILNLSEWNAATALLLLACVILASTALAFVVWRFVEVPIGIWLARQPKHLSVAAEARCYKAL